METILENPSANRLGLTGRIGVLFAAWRDLVNDDIVDFSKGRS